MTITLHSILPLVTLLRLEISRYHNPAGDLAAGRMFNGEDPMDVDRFAKQTHRRGFLAALAALALPATAQKAGAQFARCSPRGGGCTLSVHCCGNIKCYRDLLNPNSGICGGVRIEDDGPSFILPTQSGGAGNTSDSSSNRGSEAQPNYDQLLVRYDRNRSGDIDCEDFDCRSDAQAFHDAYPGNPWRLDRDNDGGACEVYDYSLTCRE